MAYAGGTEQRLQPSHMRCSSSNSATEDRLARDVAKTRTRTRINSRHAFLVTPHGSGGRGAALDRASAAFARYFRKSSSFSACQSQVPPRAPITYSRSQYDAPRLSIATRKHNGVNRQALARPSHPFLIRLRRSFAIRNTMSTSALVSSRVASSGVEASSINAQPRRSRWRIFRGAAAIRTINPISSSSSRTAAGSGRLGVESLTIAPIWQGYGEPALIKCGFQSVNLDARQHVADVQFHAPQAVRGRA